MDLSFSRSSLSCKSMDSIKSYSTSVSEGRSPKKVYLAVCKHEFFALCLEELLKKEATCPSCKESIPLTSSESNQIELQTANIADQVIGRGANGHHILLEQKNEWGPELVESVEDVKLVSDKCRFQKRIEGK